MFDATLIESATELLQTCRAKHIKIATVESCTGGLVAALLTEVAGSSDVFERGYVTYANDAKMELVDVPEALLATHGAVSKQVAIAMAEGALQNAPVQLTVAITGVAGPGGGTAQKPVGLVHLASACSHKPVLHVEQHFAGTRSEVRYQAVQSALSLMQQQVHS